MEWQSVNVKKAVTLFHQCLSVNQVSLLERKLKQQGIVPVNIQENDSVYFEPESLRVFQNVYSLPSFSARTSTRLRIRFQPTLYEFPYGVVILTLRCEPSSSERQISFVDVLRLNENYRYTKLRSFQRSHRQLYDLSEFSEYSDDNLAQPIVMAEILGIVRRRFLPDNTTDLFPTFGKMTISGFVNLAEPLSREMLRRFWFGVASCILYWGQISGDSILN